MESNSITTTMVLSKSRLLQTKWSLMTNLFYLVPAERHAIYLSCYSSKFGRSIFFTLDQYGLSSVVKILTAEVSVLAGGAWGAKAAEVLNEETNLIFSQQARQTLYFLTSSEQPFRNERVSMKFLLPMIVQSSPNTDSHKRHLGMSLIIKKFNYTHEKCL